MSRSRCGPGESRWWPSRSSYGSSLAALDERLTRQLHIAELACELERPQVAGLHSCDAACCPHLLHSVSGVLGLLASLSLWGHRRGG